jgi:hypothetical protein
MQPSNYCRRLSQAEAYARLLAMRQGLYDGSGVAIMQKEQVTTGLQDTQKDQLPLSLQKLRRRPVQVDTGADSLPETESTPVIMSVEGRQDKSVQTAVQNFRKILMDIEKQQALQREQLEKVVQ